MAEPTSATDEELELEREQEEESPDVKETKIPTGEESGEDEEQDESEEDKESGTSADEDSKEEQENPEETDGSQEDEPKKPTRKERRAERAKRFSELRPDFSQRDAQRQQLTARQKYNPMDYNQTDENLTVEQLEADRNKYAESKMSEGMQIERFYAEQERFNDRLESDNDYVLSKPDYAFMDETSDSFDADLADGINDLYLTMAGYDGSSKTYANTGVRYKQFVPMMKQMMDKYAATRNANSERNISKQRGSAGVRPTANSSRGSRTFSPEQIARMSPSQYARYEKDIERQINSLI